MTMLRTLITVSALALALAACSSEGGKLSHDAGAEPDEDAALEPEPEVETDDAGAPPVAPVPLTVWVDDLVENHTTDDAEPDTVDDKVITDDTDESSFDKYLP
jgi:hypothetical protein